MTPTPPSDARGAGFLGHSGTGRRWNSETSLRLIVAIVVIATTGRIAVNLALGNPAASLYSDMANYDRIARRLLRLAFGPSDTFIAIGYPAFLAAIHAVSGRSLVVIGIIQSVLGGLTCLLVWLIAGRLTSSRAAALGAMAVVAAYPPLIYYGSLLLTEAVAPFCLTLTFWLLLRAVDLPSFGRCALAGGALSAATLVRPNFLLLYPFIGLFVWTALRLHTGKGLRAASLVLVSAMPLLILVAANNSRVMGRPVGLATNGGLNFFMLQADVRGVQATDATWLPVRNLLFDEKVQVPVRSYDEAYFYRAGMAAFLARRDKLAHVLRNMGEGFGLGYQAYWPANLLPSESDRELGASWYRGLLRWCSRAFFVILVLPIMIEGLVAAIGRRLLRPESAMVLLGCSCVIVLAGTFAIFLADPRVHVPFDPLFMALAAATLSRVLSRLST